MHLKAYLSEKEAIHTSVNLMRQSVDKSLESSLLFDRKEDPDGWNNVFEVRNKTLDDAVRADEGAPVEVERFLVPLRTRADAGEPGAREVNRYCLVCGATASDEADDVVCLRCRAAAIAKDQDPYAVVGGRCTRCNGPHGHSRVERPLCDSCYRAEQQRYGRRPAHWYVSGTSGSIEVWSRLDGRHAPPALHETVQRALVRRWAALLPAGGWLSASLTAITSRPVPLWTIATPPGGVDVVGLAGVLLERVPVKVLPARRDLPTFAPESGLHLAFSRGDTPRSPIHWAPEQTLAAWDIALPQNPDVKQVMTPAWVWRILLPPRKMFREDVVHEAGRIHFQIEVKLTVPGGLRGKWKEAATFLQQAMLASLHSYAEVEVREWLANAAPKMVDAVAGALVTPAPLGPAVLVRGARGTILDLPGRTDRVVAIRVAVKEGDEWHVKGAVLRVTKVPFH